MTTPTTLDPDIRILQEIPPERRVRATENLFAGNTVVCFAGELRDAESAFVKQHKRYFVRDPQGPG